MRPVPSEGMVEQAKNHHGFRPQRSNPGYAFRPQKSEVAHLIKDISWRFSTTSHPGVHAVRISLEVEVRGRLLLCAHFDTHASRSVLVHRLKRMIYGSSSTRFTIFF